MFDVTDKLAMIDVYEVLGLDRGDATEDLLAEVRFLRAHWEPRVGRPGATGEAAQANMEAIELAEQAFADEEARAQYEVHLAGQSELQLALELMPDFDPSVDYYDLLGLDRGDSAADIRSALAGAKVNWLRRSSRRGGCG